MKMEDRPDYVGAVELNRTTGPQVQDMNRKQVGFTRLSTCPGDNALFRYRSEAIKGKVTWPFLGQHP